MCRNLSFGLTTKARGCKVVGQKEAMSHVACSRECKKVWWNRPSHSQKELPLWELESRWTFEFSECDYRGQNPSYWKVPYIIGKLLKLRCLNGLAWPIWTSETQVMAKRRAKSQIGSLTPDHKKLGIDSIPLRASSVRHVVGKLSMRAKTLF
jgi:hypothetical protein